MILKALKVWRIFWSICSLWAQRNTQSKLIIAHSYNQTQEVIYLYFFSSTKKRKCFDFFT